MNSSALWSEFWSINATNVTHEYVYHGWAHDPEYLARIYSVTIINDSLCLLSSIICLTIIFKYYIPIKSIIKPVKYTSILATIFWMLSNIAWVINWHHEPMMLSLTFSEYPTTYQIFVYSNVCALYTQGMGYAFFGLSFYFRIIHAFKDSMFEVSKYWQILTIAALLTFCVIFGVLSVLKAVRFDGDPILDLTYSVFGLFSCVMYIIGSIVGLRMMLVKLYRFKQFIQTVTPKKRKRYHCRQQSNFDSNSETAKDLYKLMKRITVLYSFALFSTISVLCFTIVFIIVTIVIHGIYSNDYWTTVPVMTILYTYRTLNVIDSTLNTICLFFQNDIATTMYNKYCAFCDRNIVKCCCCCRCYKANSDVVHSGLSFNIVVK